MSEIFILFFFIFFLFRIIKISLLMLIGKIGIPPFFKWLLEIFWKIKGFSLILLISLTKCLPTFLLLRLTSFYLWQLFFFRFFFVQRFSFINQKNEKLIILFSSFSHIVLFLLVNRFSKLLSFKYFLCYLFTLLFLLSFTNSGALRINRVILFNLVGLPPAILFFFKLFSLFYLLNFRVFFFILVIITIIFYIVYFLFFLEIIIKERFLNFFNRIYQQLIFHLILIGFFLI